MKVLVLGGTHHVGRAVVEAALGRGDAVTTFSRGVSGAPAAGARAIYGERNSSGDPFSPLRGEDFDLVVDTWQGAPRAVRAAAGEFSGRAGCYCYVSTRSVYRWPIPCEADEGAPVVDGDPDAAEPGDYGAAKRGGELAAAAAFGGPVLVARPGLILGPYERTGRMPWWLRRIERGGEVLAPGPEGRPLQYIDGRDLAAWLLAAGGRGLAGEFNTVSRPGHATMGSLLGAAVAAVGSGARLVWAPPEVILAAGIEPWTELPVWVPPEGELAGLHDGDVSKAYAAGLRCRPVAETVADTWEWLLREGDPPVPPAQPGLPARPGVGLDPERERAVLAGLPLG